jgi:hypothetical protein
MRVFRDKSARRELCIADATFMMSRDTSAAPHSKYSMLSLMLTRSPFAVREPLDIPRAGKDRGDLEHKK